MVLFSLKICSHCPRFFTRTHLFLTSAFFQKSAKMSAKAIRVHEFGGTDVLHYEDVPTFSQLETNEVIVEVKAAGVNPVDTYIRSGTYGTLPKLPYIPGKDAAGIVKEVHPAVTNVKVGQRVFTCSMRKPHSGTYAQFLKVHSKEVYPLSDKLTFSQGAGLGVPYFTAYRALLMKAKGKAGDTVLIHGASGGVGLGTVQMAKAYGMRVLGTAGTPEGMALIKECGADKVFCHRDADYMNSIMECTDGKGVNIIIEMLSNVNLAKDLTILAQKGCVIIVGARGPVEIQPRLMMMPETSIIGVALPSSNKEEMHEISEAILTGIDKGWACPVVDKEYKLKDAAQAQHDIIESKGAKGNLVLTVP